MISKKKPKKPNDSRGLALSPNDSLPVRAIVSPPLPTYTVSELSRIVKNLIEDRFSRIRIRGEISQLRKIETGHYFRLKDESSLIEVVCWRSVVDRLRIVPEDGLEVICTGRLTIYPKRSLYQFMVSAIELAGQGALLKLLEDRKKRLADEGLFALDRKRRLPYLPEIIGVVTSPNGVVIHDILDRLNDRFPRRVLLWPASVEGKNAAWQVKAGIEGFGKLTKEDDPPRPDVIIVARGGGFLEDLMPFNEESVVRAAAASEIPLISAIGHETDTTLLDLVADVRAPTPTAAAEIVVPVRAQLLERLSEIKERVLRSVYRRFSEQRAQVAMCNSGMRDPQTIIESTSQRLDEYTIHLERACKLELTRSASRLSELAASLRHPRTIIKNASDRVTDYVVRLDQGCKVDLVRKEGKLNELMTRLESQEERIFTIFYLSVERLVERLDSVAQEEFIQRIHMKYDVLDDFYSRLSGVWRRRLDHAKQRLTTFVQVFESLSYKKVLQRGYVMVRDASDGRTVTSSDQTSGGQKIVLTFYDGDRGATIDDFADKSVKPHVKQNKETNKETNKVSSTNQRFKEEDLFTQRKV